MTSGPTASHNNGAAQRHQGGGFAVGDLVQPGPLAPPDLQRLGVRTVTAVSGGAVWVSDWSGPIKAAFLIPVVGEARWAGRAR